jgi:hypothetical protein
MSARIKTSFPLLELFKALFFDVPFLTDSLFCNDAAILAGGPALRRGTTLVFYSVTVAKYKRLLVLH